jgi:phosphatidylserine/phosphatidylglycerophosphate/cardiolipin synthase-like enzyme
MIALAHGRGVDQLLQRAAAQPWLYSNLIICCPFIDSTLMARLNDLCRRAAKWHCGMTLITTPSAAAHIRRSVGAAVFPRLRIVVRSNLHAKVYYALARGRHARSEALVTSANLTEAGISRNEELGVHIRGDSPEGRALLRQINTSLRRITAHYT